MVKQKNARRSGRLRLTFLYENIIIQLLKKKPSKGFSIFTVEIIAF